MKYLGLDYGQAKIGLAISEGSIASPYAVIPVNSWQLQLKNIIKKEGIDIIIIGVSENKIGEETKKFAREVTKVLNIKVELFDETLTTKEALKSMISSGRSQKYRKEMEDAVAAAVILQGYLDNLSSRA